MIVDVFHNRYFDTILIIIALLVISKIITFIIEKVVKSFTKRTKTKLDDIFISKTEKISVWLLFFIGIRVFVMPLLELKALDMINNAVIIFFVTLFVIRVVDFIIDSWGASFAKRTKSRVDEELLVLFHRFSRIALFIIGGILILNAFHVEITPFLASLGIIGIVLGFALQSSLSNIFGGISLILDKNFKVGDVIKLSSGELGKVLDIGLRSTKIRTFENEMLIIPNGKLAESIIDNYAQPDLYARATVAFGVEYGSNVEKVRKIVMETLRKMPKVIKDDKGYPVEVLFMRMGDFALEMEARLWVKSYTEKFHTKIEATEKIYNALMKSKINIPFPTRTVYLKK